MKEYLFTLIFAVLSSAAYSQSFTIENVVGRGQYFKYETETQYEKWTVKYLNVTKDSDSYKVSCQLYNVNESFYDEIPNDTTVYTFIGDFTKSTRKDGTGYTLKHSEEDGYANYTVSVCKSGCFDEITIMIHYQVLTSGYVVFIDMTTEEFQKCQHN